MNNDFLEQMWPAFEAEVGEQLDALEQLLVRDVDTDINAVFRQFHTIKSSSAMMEFRGMESIAHAAEDLLALLRGDRLDFDTACRDTLLQAIDTLRRQLQSAMATRQAPAADDALVARLRALASAAPAAAVAAATPAAENSSALTAYLEQSRYLLPELARACLRDEAPPPTVPALAERASQAGLTALARLLQQLATDPANRLSRLADILARQRHVEKLAGSDSAAQAGADVWRHVQDALLTAPLQAAAAIARTPLATAADANAWLAAADRLLDILRIAGLQASERVLRLARQALREIERETRASTPDLHARLKVALNLPADLDPVLGEDEPYRALAEQTLLSLQQALTEPPVAVVPTATGCVEIDADLENLADRGAAFIDWLSTEGRLLGSHTVFDGSGDTATTRLRFRAELPLSPAEIRNALAGFDPDGKHFELLAGDSLPATATEQPALPQSVPEETRSDSAVRSTLRVDSRTLDTFVNRLGELVMLRNMMAHTLVDNETSHGLQRLREVIAGGSTVTAEERTQLLDVIGRLGTQRERLLHADNRLQGTLGQLQEDVLSLRVVPVGVVFNRMTRIVRQLADAQGKQVRLDFSGDDVRIDKGMVDLLVEPLTHMVRNAIDHGLEAPERRRAAGKPETGTLRLAARQHGNTISVTVADDGRGLDHARILAKARAQGIAGNGDYSTRDIAAFIFAPGFSTAEKVTEVSGRGVGMDVVRTRIAQIGGQVDVQSDAGAGTVFTLRLPLSVAIQNVIIVRAEGRRHALPERHVNEILRVPVADVQTVRNQAACLLRGQTLPLYRLDMLLGRPAAPAAGRDLCVLVVTDGTHRIGLIVDDIDGRQEVFVRDIHPQLMRLPGVGGAAILGDGQVVVITDCDNLMTLARRKAQSLASLLRAS